MIRIVSWNVNGLRAVLRKNALAPVLRRSPDCLCLQEARVSEVPADGIPARFEHRFLNQGLRKGYSGTAIISRIAPLSAQSGIGAAEFDAEGRTLTLELPSFFLVCVYVPNSQRELTRLGFRMRWDSRFREYVRGLARTKPVVFCGDMNVAHEEIDIARPESNRMNAGFTDQERRGFSRLLGAGFVDSFRRLHAEEVRYTWWSYATRARERNVGWRIDYVCVSRSIEDRLKTAFILDRVMGSDHCPVGIDIDLP